MKTGFFQGCMRRVRVLNNTFCDRNSECQKLIAYYVGTLAFIRMLGMLNICKKQCTSAKRALAFFKEKVSLCRDTASGQKHCIVLKKDRTL
jgi:hypothetical protein